MDIQEEQVDVESLRRDLELKGGGYGPGDLQLVVDRFECLGWRSLDSDDVVVLRQLALLRSLEMVNCKSSPDRTVVESCNEVQMEEI